MTKEIIALAEKHCDFIRIYSDSEVRHYLFTPEQLQSFAAALTAQPAAPAVVEWISVDDERKPPLDQVILMWVYAENEGEDDDGRPFSTDASQVQMGVYRDMGHGPFFDCFATPFADHEGVTHWMPLPPAPAIRALSSKEAEHG
jgi:hypothetical protein